jgi:hypothetical protein
MTDLNPTETVDVDPPLEESATPLMGNPILTRQSPRRQSSPSRMAWYLGVPIAVIAVGAAAYFVSTTTHPGSTAPAEQVAQATPPAAVAPAPAPTPAPASVSTPEPVAPPPMAAAAPMEPVQPLHPPRVETTRSRLATRHATSHRAATAEESGADVSATAPAMPPPVTAAPPPAAPASPPVIVPPPSQ